MNFEVKFESTEESFKAEFGEVIRPGKDEIKPKEITANGEYLAKDDGAVGYNPVVVNVPGPILQEKTATENGVVLPDDGMDGLSKVTVNVPSGDETIKGILDRSITSFRSNSVTAIGDYAFHYCEKLAELNIPNVTRLGMYSFGYCKGLATVNFPNVTNIGTDCFVRCENLESAYLDSVTQPSGYTFLYCNKLRFVHMPKLTNTNTGIFSDCVSLEKVNLPRLETVYNNAFKRSGIKTLILSRPDRVCSLSSVNAFNNTPIASGTGYVYVPDDLVDSYKTKTNWVTYASQIKPISELEE